MGKKIQAVVSLLQALKFDTKQIPWLTAESDDIPDDFTPDEIADEYLETRKTIAESELDVKKQIDAALKTQEQAQYKKLVGSIRTKLKRRGHFEADKEMDLDAVVDAYEKAVSTGKDDSEYKAKLDSLNKEYSEALDKIEALEADKVQLSEAQKKFESEYKDRYESEKTINAAFSAVNWAFNGEDLAERQRHMKRDIADNLIVKADGTITDRDGKPVMKADGTGRIKTINEWTDNYVDRFKLRKVSNGAEDIKTKDGKKIPEGAEGDKVRQQLRERRQLIEEKAREYGIPVEEAEEMFK